MKMDFQFTKAEHLTRKKEFERVFNEGTVFKNNKVVLYVIPNDFLHSRLGLVVKKSGELPAAQSGKTLAERGVQAE